jgi:hypothetical protein
MIINDAEFIDNAYCPRKVKIIVGEGSALVTESVIDRQKGSFAKKSSDDRLLAGEFLPFLSGSTVDEGQKSATGGIQRTSDTIQRTTEEGLSMNYALNNREIES